ncbi:MAG: hypothetical protein L0H70_05495 [Xanthomonadales bacterium]|nr:hypothetical protein [Xanthomonadales bacterium]
MTTSVRLLKRFLLATVLWLPVAFLVWALLGQWLAYVPGLLTDSIVTGAWPQLFTDFVQQGTTYSVGTGLVVSQHGGIGQLVLTLNPLMYGYSLPLLGALVMATPLSPGRRAAQWLLALPLLWLAQVFGLVMEALRILVFSTGAQGANAAAANGLDANMVALLYQFGYLILPAVLPVVLWILMNRQFIESLGRTQTEPVS